MIQKSTISFSEALKFWLKLGFISFGGPAGQIAIMHRELVEQRRWISEGRFLHALNYCMVLPGPEAQQLATYIGWLMHGKLGGIVAGGLFVLPSIFIMIGLSWIYLAFGTLPLVAGLLYGIKPAVCAIVLFAAWRIGTKTLTNPWLWLIALASFGAIFFLDTPFPLIVLIAAIIGMVGGRVAPSVFSGGSKHADATSSHDSAIIDNATPPPAHARFSLAGAGKVTLIGLAMWLVAVALLVHFDGIKGTLTQMAWFFTKAALLTFGGAYAVLPYVYQGAVDKFTWLTPQQMIDGLALGETTPGPLIMVLAFVGFVGAWTKQVLGPEALFAAGALAAVIVTFFTFLPSFLFILVGGPFIETTRGQLKFTAPLTAITAAVVGVIVNLGIFFIWHVGWPKSTQLAPFSGGFEWFSGMISLAAAVALIRLKVGIITVLGVSALIGVALQFLWGT